MFKRLIFAVFVLGLVLTFSGTAISDIGMKEGLNPVPTSNPNAPLYGVGLDGRADQSDYRIPAESFVELSAGDASPTPPSGYFCDIYTYWCDSTTSFNIWDLRGNGLDYMANRFTVEGLDVCTLTVQWALLLTHPAYMVGDADAEIVVWDDNGFGFPGVERARYTVPAASFPAGPTWTWIGADFLADEIIYGPGDEYHVGVGFVYNSPDDDVWVPTDMAQPWLDHSGQERGSFYDGGGAAWGTILAMTGADRAPVIESEWCGYETPFSDCYDLSYATNAYWVYPAPHDGYGFTEYAMRFSINSPETLTAVHVAIYDFTSWGEPTAIPGNDDIIITVYADNGGYPDDGVILGTGTMLAGTYGFYPSFSSVDIATLPVFSAGDQFHVSFASTGAVGTDYEVIVGDDGTGSDARGYVRDDPGFVGPAGEWSTMMDMYGENDLFHIVSTMCIDPYNTCYSVNYNTGADYFWYLPDVYGSTANAQHYKAVGIDCKIDEVSFALFDNGDPNDYTTDSKVSVYLDGGGVPALELASIVLTPADYVLYPGRTTVDFGPLDLFLTGDFWIAIESYGTDETDGIRTISDLGGSAQHYGAAELWNGTWGLMANNWVGIPTDLAFDVQGNWCCVPLPVWPCTYTGEWATAQWDDARTGHAQVHTGAPNEDLELNWSWDHPTDQAYFANPTVYDGKIICAFESEYTVLDLVTGTVLYSIIPDNDNGTIRGLPLATNLGGTDYVFISSGAGRSVECWNFDAGTFVWEYANISAGTNRYSSFQLLNIGGVDVLYYGTDDGNIIALDAATGLEFAYWLTNPVNIGYGVGFSGATDGSKLFYATFAGGFDCDVVALNANDGTTAWSLAGDWDLLGETVYPTEAISGEGFQSGVSYDRGTVYANSYPSDGAHPADGILYSLNSTDGAPNWAVASARTLYNTPAIDQQSVYEGFFSRWVSPPIGGNIASFNRAAGAIDWVSGHANDDNYYNAIAITCEDDTDELTPDLIFAGGHKGFFSCYDSETGDQIFDRQINYGNPFSSMFNGISLVRGDGVEYKYHVVASHFFGGLSVQSATVAKANRPRLEIQSYSPAISVEFGLATSYPVDIPDLLLNTGGSALTINDITTDETCFDYHPEFSSVRPGVADQAMTIAEQLTSDKLLKATRLQDSFDERFGVRDISKELSLNAGAMARPAFIQIATDPDGILAPADGYMMAPGELIPVTVDINQSLIQRGSQTFSMYIDTDDPDFYLNPFPLGGDIPCVFVNVVGGCLLDTANLAFGMGCGNLQVVTNTGRMGTGDWDPHAFDIDGMTAEYYQGTYFYANSQYQIAMNTQDWSGGGGEAESWWSMQADPNWYDGGCPPPYVEDVPASCFGGYTTDGYDYTLLYGNAVYKTYIDSVQNFDLGGGWDWENWGAPFDNSLTMGLWVNSITVGICDFEPLKDVTVEIIQIHERNGNPVADWAMGAMVDYDIGGDTALIDRSISTVWSPSASGGDVAFGMIKLPFGCNTNANTSFEPMWNAGHLDANQAQFSGVYWDSAYYYTQLPAGLFGHTVTGAADQELHATFIKHDFGADDTLMFAIANFGMSGLADSHDPAEYAPLANLVNKWVGFGRGDVNNDNVVDLRDLVYLKNFLYLAGPGPIPFKHLGDVNLDEVVDPMDALYLFDWYFNDGPCPQGDWCFFE